MSKGWDNTMIKRLKALTGKGLSTAEIGKRLGLSKNAVVGKLNRLGWNLKACGATMIAKTETDNKTSKVNATSAVKKSVAGVKGAKNAVANKKTTKTSVTKKTSVKKIVDKSKKVVTPKQTTKTQDKTQLLQTPKEDKKGLNKSLAMHQRIVQHALELSGLKSNQCRWPIGDPDSEDFHFCGDTVFVGKPYCYEHCKQAYQFTPPKKK